MLDAACDMEVFAPPEVVFAVLWDVARYPEFMTDIVETEVAEPETDSEDGAGSGPTQVVTLETQFVRTRRYTVRMEARPPLRVTWQLQAGDGLSHNEGSWELVPHHDGRSCLLIYRLRVGFSVPVPAAVARRMIDFNLPTLLRQVKARAEHRYWQIQT
jgi:ribosome-associated toxin RatA of RatAB toxin-antitoxin module